MNRTGALVLLLILALPCLKTSAQSERDTLVDGIVGVVGGNIILRSDIENQYLQVRSQGGIQGTASSLKCQIYEGLLFQKLLLHQAQVDSLTTTDAQVEAEMDRRMRYFISQAGSPDRLEEHFGKSLTEIKNEMREIVREQMLTDQEQMKLTGDITITPAEVKAYYRKLSKDSIPLVNSEYEIGMIVKRPVVGEAERKEARDKLMGFRERIAKGDDFSTLAVLYSEDPGSSKQGGELGMFQRGEMRLEFEAAAFKLKPGEVSDIVETEDGFHLIQMIERRGDFINVRHILVQPKVSVADMNQAKLTLDSVANLITQKKMTFAEAVVRFSDDLSRNSGGWMVNPATGNNRFESNQIDARIFFIIDKLKAGEVSAPVPYNERGKQDYRLYYLKSRTNPHKATLEEDYTRIQQIALEKKKMEAVNEWIDRKMKNTYIFISEPFRQCTFQRKWITN